MGVNCLAPTRVIVELSRGAKTLNDRGSAGSKRRGGNVATTRGSLTMDLDEACLEESTRSAATS